MKIAYKDIIKFLSIKPSIEELSFRLYQLGHEHTIADQIFDFEFTPNRGDCLSVLGIARDLNPFFKFENSLDLYENEIESFNLDFENDSPADCPEITFLNIEIDNQESEYMAYLDDYLKKNDMKRNNLFADISNYLSYETGQPSHCYDSNKINKKLVFQKNDCNENFKTLIDSEIQLEGTNCVFSMADEVICLAGIIGGSSTCSSNKTTNCLIEFAYFNPESITGKATRYKTNSDAAYKFERGVDRCQQDRAMRRFIQIISEHAKINKISSYKYQKDEYLPVEIPFNPKIINDILGIDISNKEYIEILESLQFDIQDTIKVPSFRNDISHQNDLAEEVARVIGYDNIANKEFKLLPSIENIKPKINTLLLRSNLIKSGFCEVINFPFTSNNNKDSFVVDNPLDTGKAYLRTSTKDSLIENLLFNERRQKDSVKLFEFTNIYEKDDNINSRRVLGIIASGRVGHNYNEFSKKIDESYISDLIKDFFKNINFEVERIPRETLNTKIKSNIFYVELDLEKLDGISDEENSYLKVETFNKFEGISDFPSSTRDFSFLISETQLVDDLLEILRTVEEEYLKESFIFDIFEDKKNNQVKVGFRMIFQANSKTLSDADIQKSIYRILDPILEIDGISIPGL